MTDDAGRALIAGGATMVDAYYPFSPGVPAPAPRPSEPLWQLRKNHHTWSAELRFFGESYGWDAQILNDSELVIAHRFVVHEEAIAWANSQKGFVERGWIDA